MRQAVARDEKIIRADPDAPQFRLALVDAYGDLGRIFLYAGRDKEAAGALGARPWNSAN